MRARKTTLSASRSVALTLAPPSSHAAGSVRGCAMPPLPRALRSDSSTPPCTRSARESSQSRRTRNRLRREILAGLEEFDLRPPFLDQPEIDSRGREVHQFTGMIDGEIVIGLYSKLAEPLLVAEAHPSRHGHIDRLEHALHAVFVLQTKSDDF